MKNKILNYYNSVSSLRKNFILFFATIIFVIIAFSGYFSDAFLNYSQIEISNSLIGKLKMNAQIDQIIQNSITETATTLSTDVTLNKEYNKLINSDNFKRNFTENAIASKLRIDSVDAESILIIKNKLSDLGISNNLIRSTYVYLIDFDIIISSKDGISRVCDFKDTDWIEQSYKHFGPKIISFWLDTRLPVNNKLSTTNQPKLPFILINENNDPVISYLFPLTLNQPYIKGVIVINIDEKKYTSMINSKRYNAEGILFKVNKDGIIQNHPLNEFVLKNIESTYYSEMFSKDIKGEGSFVATVNNERKLFTYYKPADANFTYIGDYSLDKMVSNVENIRNYIYICAFIVIVFITILAYIVSKKLFSPVISLVNKIKQYSKEKIVTKSEITLLETIFEKLIKENASLSQQIKKEAKNDIDILINNAINYRPTENVEKIFPNNYFICACISIDDYKEFSKAFKNEQSYYIKQIIIKLSEDIINQHFICYGTIHRKEKIVLIINMLNSDIENFAILKECFLKIKFEVEKIMKYSLSIGIGCLYENISNSYYSFNESIIVLNRKFILGYGQIMFFVQKYAVKPKYQYPIDIEKKIMQCLINGTSLSLRDNIQEFKQFIVDIPYISLDNSQFILNQLVSKIIEYIINEDVVLNDVLRDNTNIYQTLLEFETIDEVSEWLINIIELIINFCNKRKNLDKAYFEKAIRFIELNYQKDIDVNSLATNLETSYTQLRRIFKENTNDSIVNFVNRIRIEKAKKILISTNKTLSEIALDIGYNNDQSFNRYFKKFENSTPGEYRNKYKK